CAPVRRVDAPRDSEQIVHSAVRRAVRVEDKARFQDRPVGREEGGDEVGGAVEVGNADLRIRAWTASADRRLGVAKKTAVAIERRAQTCQWLAAQGSPDGNCLAKKRQSVKPENVLVVGQPGDRIPGPGRRLRSRTRARVRYCGRTLCLHCPSVNSHQQCRYHNATRQTPEKQIAICSKDWNFHTFFPFHFCQLTLQSLCKVRGEPAVARFKRRGLENPPHDCELDAREAGWMSSRKPISEISK